MFKIVYLDYANQEQSETWTTLKATTARVEQLKAEGLEIVRVVHIR
jgi:hypothetical protein